MVGIERYGSYIPKYRISGETLSVIWGTSSRGERSVANYDEDSITMSADAIMNCMGNKDPARVDGLYMASTSLPYTEKGNSTIIASAVDIRYDVFTADFSGSLRSGTSALLAALHMVKGGNANSVLVAAADVRIPEPGAQDEIASGDGAACFLIGDRDPYIEFIDSYSISREFVDTWRTGKDLYTHKSDLKFVQDQCYAPTVVETVKGLLNKTGLEVGDISCIAPYAPNLPVYNGIIKRLGMEGGDETGGSLYSSTGETGSSFPLLLLQGVLDKAKAGDKIIVVGYGGGCDAVLFRVVREPENGCGKGILEKQMKSKRTLSHYGRYMRFREIVPVEKPEPFTSPVILLREERANLRLYGSKCNQCGRLHYPPRRICLGCRAKDDYKEVKMSRRGKVYTYTKDHLPPSSDAPVIMVSADLEGGGRFYGQLTDCDPSDVSIGMEVELCFRRIHEGGGFFNYFWKFRPVI